MTDNVIVAVRVRPPNGTELGSAVHRPIIQQLNECCITFDPAQQNEAFDGASARITSRPMPGHKRSKDLQYKFDYVFGSDATQADVYEQTAQRVIDKVCSGINATVFAYGATGSGKTHTMVGNEDEPGVMVRTVQDLFARIEEMSLAQGDDSLSSFSLSLSYLEVYNETIRDLLTDNSGPLQLNEDKAGRMSVKGLTEKRDLKCARDVFNLLKQGNNRRTQCATDQNAQSSRSHAVLQIVVKKLEPPSSSNTAAAAAADSNMTDIDGGVMSELWTSKLSLIDLAGSERAAGSSNKGSVQKEGANINKSLLALGNVISALAQKAKSQSAAASGTRSTSVSRAGSTKKGGSASAPSTARPRSASTAVSNVNHIPFRGSKLTRLLKCSLGGNCMTVMIAAVSPSSLSREDTHNTLKYADRAKQIKVDAKQNIQGVKLHMAAYVGQIEQLRKQVENLTKTNQELKQSAISMANHQLNSSTSYDNEATQAQQVELMTRYREKMDSLFRKRNTYDSKVTEMKHAVIRAHIFSALYSHIKEAYIQHHAAAKEGHLNQEIINELQSKISTIDSQRRAHQATQKSIVTMHIDPLNIQINELKNAIQQATLFHSAPLKKENQTILQMEIEMKIMQQQLQEKDSAISNYSEMISSITSHLHSCSKSLLKLLQYSLVNSSTTPAILALFMPNTNNAHAQFMSGVKRIVDEGLLSHMRSERDEMSMDGVVGDEKEDTASSFVVETISITPRQTNNNDEADEEATPEPAVSHASYASVASHVAVAPVTSTAATPSRSANHAPRLLSAPIVATHITNMGLVPASPARGPMSSFPSAPTSLLLGGHAPMFPTAAFATSTTNSQAVAAAVVAVPAATPKRRSGRRSRSSMQKRIAAQQQELEQVSQLSMSPLASASAAPSFAGVQPPTTVEASIAEMDSDVDIVMESSPAPSSASRRSYRDALNVSQSPASPSPSTLLTPTRKSNTPIINHKPVTKEMFSPQYNGLKQALAGISTPSRVAGSSSLLSPAAIGASLAQSFSTSPAVKKQKVVSASPTTSQAKGQLSSQLNDWEKELSEIQQNFPMAVRPAHSRHHEEAAQIAANLSAANQGRGLKRRNEMPMPNALSISSSASLPALHSSSSSATTSSAFSIASSSLSTFPSTNSASTVVPHLPLHSLTSQSAPSSTLVTPAGAPSKATSTLTSINSKLKLLNKGSNNSLVTTLPSVTQTSAGKNALNAAGSSSNATPTLQRKPPIPKQNININKLKPLLHSNSSASVTPAMEDGENDHPEDSHLSSQGVRPTTAPLSSRTDSYSSLHNQRQAMAAGNLASQPVPIPTTNKTKLLAANFGGLLSSSASGSPAGSLGSLGKHNSLPQMSPVGKKHASSAATTTAAPLLSSSSFTRGLAGASPSVKRY